MTQPQATHSFIVIIIGAGLAGSLLANRLLHASIPVTVYERGEENNSSGEYQIHLGESALIGLRACMSEAEISSVVAKFGRAGGRKGQGAVLRHKDFGLLLDLKAFPDYTKSRSYQAGHTEGCAGGALGASGRRAVSQQLGLNNLTEIKTHIQLLIKQEMPTERLLTLGREFTSGPVLAFADNKTFYFSVPTEKWNFVSKGFAGWAPQFHQALEAVRDSDFIVYPARTSSRPPNDWRQKNFEDACKTFEDEMIPRTFEWVKKSGGNETIPFDSSKIGTQVLFAIASKLVLFAPLWTSVKRWLGFSNPVNLNDAPELRD
ncbi:Monooxygenase FAD-binding protein [Diaporthe eres]|nr:Monooxygenase FAD-binding protein [Diaporthe eres]